MSPSPIRADRDWRGKVFFQKSSACTHGSFRLPAPCESRRTVEFDEAALRSRAAQPARAGARPAGDLSRPVAGAALPALEKGIQWRRHFPGVPRGLREHFQLRREREPAEGHAAGGCLVASNWGVATSWRAGGRFARQRVNSFSGGCVRLPNRTAPGDEDFIVGLREAEAKLVQVRRDVRQIARDERSPGGGGFEIGQAEAFLDGRQQHGLAGGQQFGHGGLLFSSPCRIPRRNRQRCCCAARFSFSK
jgi:hypothetical protein